MTKVRHLALYTRGPKSLGPQHPQNTMPWKQSCSAEAAYDTGRKWNLEELILFRALPWQQRAEVAT